MTAKDLDLTSATLATIGDDARDRGRQAVLALVEEVEKRSGIRWTVAPSFPDANVAQIVLCTDGEVEALPAELRSAVEELPPAGPEGFRLAIREPGPVVLVVGHDRRGLLYGVGRLLRRMAMRPGSVSVPVDLSVSTTPKAQIRGHQLGYRPKNNTYDAWTPAQFEQTIRELAFFGANSIEILPPRTDDALTNDLMPVPPMEMMETLAEIVDRYGLDLWVWYPNVGEDYSDPVCREEELAERDEVFSRLKRVDHVFIPGGDPGDLSPEALFAWSAQVAEVLRRHHPQAMIWLSPQVFRPGEGWLEGFYAQVDRRPDWLGGVVYGPWVPTSLPKMRRRLPSGVPIRRYPDIAHSLQCQYPVPEWDVAFALTHGREGINPRPVAMKRIHNRLAGYAVGSITYSEGINDDVNKFVWADQAWDPEMPVVTTLRDYVRLFIGPDVVSVVAQAILALERNWQGALAVNRAVDTTLRQWQSIATYAPPGVLESYRFQLGLLRAYCDAYIRRRLLHEMELQQWALDVLRQAPHIGAKRALSHAAAILDSAETSQMVRDFRLRLRTWCEQLADNLFASVGLQSSVARHGAQSWGRGAFMDGLDLPLSSAPWLQRRIAEIRAMVDEAPSEARPTSEARQLAAIEALLQREDPGPGGRYLDLGAPGYSAHALVSGKPWDEDPGFLASPLVGFNLEGIGRLHAGSTSDGVVPLPLAQLRHLATLYETPLLLRLDHLDSGPYTLCVVYGSVRPPVELTTHGVVLIPQWASDDGRVATYEIPPLLIRHGELLLCWRPGHGMRGVAVAELWLRLNTRDGQGAEGG
jgi:hypothetical protein